MKVGTVMVTVTGDRYHIAQDQQLRAPIAVTITSPQKKKMVT